MIKGFCDLFDQRSIGGEAISLKLNRLQFVDISKTVSTDEINRYPHTTRDYYLTGKLLILITQLCNIYVENSKKPSGAFPKDEEALMRALTMIHKRYNESLTISDLAKAANLSKSTFMRKFIAIYDMPPNEYLGKLRLEIAEGLLLNTNFSLGEIAEKCGFYDLSHFSKAFKRKRGLTPSEYRGKINT